MGSLPRWGSEKLILLDRAGITIKENGDVAAEPDKPADSSLIAELTETFGLQQHL